MAGRTAAVIDNVPGGRMVQTGQFVHDYLGQPDMDMAAIAKGFGVDGEVVENPAQLREALARARKHTVEGKPYLIDAQVARKGVGLGRQAVGPADPGGGAAAEEGLVSRFRRSYHLAGRTFTNVGNKGTLASL